MQQNVVWSSFLEHDFIFILEIKMKERNIEIGEIDEVESMKLV